MSVYNIKKRQNSSRAIKWFFFHLSLKGVIAVFVICYTMYRGRNYFCILHSFCRRGRHRDIGFWSNLNYHSFSFLKCSVVKIPVHVYNKYFYFKVVFLLCRQFHQHFSHAFFVRIFCRSQNVTRKSCQNNVRTKNSYVKMLMKLTPAEAAADIDLS